MMTGQMCGCLSLLLSMHISRPRLVCFCDSLSLNAFVVTLLLAAVRHRAGSRHGVVHFVFDMGATVWRVYRFLLLCSSAGIFLSNDCATHAFEGDGEHQGLHALLV